MNDLSINDPCLLFALRRESAPFLGEFRPHQSFPGAPCRARFCGPAWLTVLVLETGIGEGRAAAAADWLLGGPRLGEVPYQPKLVLAAGFAGGLRDGLGVGAVVLADEVADLEGNVWPATWPGELPDGEWWPPLHRGRVLTAPRLITDAAEKQSLGERFQAVAVDMESAAVARRCHQRGVPFGCVRVISDDWHTPLSPQLAALVSGGQVSPWAVLTTLLTAPRLAGEMARLAAHTRHAARQLGRALGELLTLTLPWGEDE